MQARKKVAAKATSFVLMCFCFDVFGSMRLAAID
jgi:hypothetical protein